MIKIKNSKSKYKWGGYLVLIPKECELNNFPTRSADFSLSHSIPRS